MSTLHTYLEQALDSLNQALLILNQQQHVVYASSHADGILALNDGLATRNGMLSATVGADDAHLRMHLGKLGSSEASSGGKGELRIHRPSGKMPYKLRITPLQPGKKEAGDAQSGALVIIQDTHANYEAWFDRLMERYNLTPRECECTIQLAEGYTMAEVAERMDISRQTLRQHLKHAFQKTGTHKQHELVGIALQMLRKR